MMSSAPRFERLIASPRSACMREISPWKRTRRTVPPRGSLAGRTAPDRLPGIREWAGSLAGSREATPPAVVYSKNRWAPNYPYCKEPTSRVIGLQLLMSQGNYRKPLLLTVIRTLRQMFSNWEYDGSFVNLGKSQVHCDKK
jgi:hypothetical protein